MGRTVAPFSRVLKAEFESWSKFRRALRREDQEAMDALFAAAKFHLAAMVYASRLTPLEAILMGILVEHQKALTRLQGRVRELEGESPAAFRLTPPASGGDPQTKSGPVLAEG